MESIDVASLTKGTLDHFLPDVERIKGVLKEPSKNQETLIDQLQEEIARFRDEKMISDVTSVIDAIPHYRQKLQAIRDEMNRLHERSTKLKRRAKKIEEQRRRDDEERQKALEREKRREKLLEAKLPDEM